MPKPLACTSIDDSSLSSQYRGRPHSLIRILGISLVIKLNVSTPLTYPRDISSFHDLAKLLSLTLWSFLLKSRMSLFLRRLTHWFLFWRRRCEGAAPGVPDQGQVLGIQQFPAVGLEGPRYHSARQQLPAGHSSAVSPIPRSIIPIGLWQGI